MNDFFSIENRRQRIFIHFIGFNVEYLMANREKNVV